MEAWYTTALDIEEVLSGAVDSHVHLFVADVVKSFDTVDRGILDSVLSSLGLPAWFRHAYFEYHMCACGLSLLLTLVSPGLVMVVFSKGVLLSMMFIVALYLPWCRYLSAQVGVEHQSYADNLKCVSRDPDLLLSAARFTTGFVRLVGQEPAPSKCVLLSTSKEVRKDMKDWVLSQEGALWVMFSLVGGSVLFQGPLQSVQRAEMWSVILALQSSGAVHLGVDNLGQSSA